MPNAIYFDCFSGISGDMALGALLDAGLPLDALRSELAKLDLAGWSISAERGMRAFLSGTRALVQAPEQETHRHLSDVRAILERSKLSEAVCSRSLQVFTLLAEAEGRIHGIAPDQVHFHEVGALDAIIDIVGVVAGLALLQVDEVFASALPLGSGWVRAAHGRLPVPAPATLALLAQAGAPLLADETAGELVTPTGAALLAALATFGRPALRIERVGYGLGSRNPPERPNALRVWIGTTGDTPTLLHAPAASLVLLETNIDDQPAEQLAYTLEQLMALGALDAWLAPIVMKKGRAATLLAALVPADLEDAAVALILRETTTLGVRRRAVERHVADREVASVETRWGSVRLKRKRWRGEQLGAAPEYEDCARLAREHHVALRDVYLDALRAISPKN
jgi:uncharacterized protein (TIGR00299 family) protein